MPIGQLIDPLARLNRRFASLGVEPVGLAATRATEPTIGDYLKEFSTPEERESILRKMATVPLSGLSLIAGILDKPRRAIYGALGGRPREMLNLLPVPTDYLGITDPTDIRSGREALEDLDILAKNKPGLDWGDVAGFGAEVLTDPLTFAGGFLVPSLTKAGKALKKTGLLDEAYRIARHEPRSLGLDKAMGRRQYGLHGTLGDLLKEGSPLAAGPPRAQEILEGLGGLEGQLLGSTAAAGKNMLTQQARIALQKTGRSADEIARMTLDEAKQVLQGEGVWDNILAKTGGAEKAARKPLRLQSLEERLGSALEGTGQKLDDLVKEPLSTVGRFMGMGIGQKGGVMEKFAASMDTLGRSLRYSPPARYIAQKMSPAAGEMLSETGQVRSARTMEAIQEVEQAVLENFAPVFSKFDDLGIFDAEHIMKSSLDKLGDPLTEKAAKEIATKNARAVRRYAEGEFKLMEKTTISPEGEEIIKLVKDPKSFTPFELPAHLKGMGIEDDIEAVKAMIGRMREMANKSGLQMDLLDDMFIDYFPRMTYRFPDDAMNISRRKAVGTFNVHALERTFHDVPGGTNVLIEMSTDPEVSGLLRKAGVGQPQQKDVMKKIIQKLKTKYFLNEKKMTPDVLNFFATKQGESHLSVIANKVARWVGNLDPRHAEDFVPAYKLNPMESVRDYMINTVRASVSAETATDLIVANAIVGTAPKMGAVTLRNVMRDWLLIDEEQAPKVILRKLEDLFKNNPKVDELEGLGILSDDLMRDLTEGDVSNLWQRHLNQVAESIEGVGKAPKEFDSYILDNIALPKDLADDVGRYLRSYSDPADAVDAIKGFKHYWDWYTNMWKGAVTSPWPAFGWRNRFSGMMSNYYAGAADPTQIGPLRFFLPNKQAHDLITGKQINGLANDVPDFRRAGITSDAEATQQLAEEIWSGNLVGRYQTRAEFIGQAGLAGKVAEQVPGMVPKERAMPLTSLAWWKALGPSKEPGAPGLVGQYMDIRGQRGVGGKKLRVLGQPGSESATWRPAVAGEMSNEYIEDLNRIAPYIAFRKQGYTVTEALRKVKLAQVDYSALTSFERNVLRRIIPFYSFTRRQIPFILEVMAERPGGPLPQMIKGIGRIRRESTKDQFLPEHIAQSIAIPIPGEQEGDHRLFLTGLSPILGGAEDVLQILRPGVDVMDSLQRGISGVSSRMHPLIQGIAEVGSGHSFYSGRPLREMESPAGRAMANMMRQTTGDPKYDEPFELDPVTDALLNRSPISRLISTARTVTDPRRAVLGPEGSSRNWITRFGPAIAGMKFADVDMAKAQNLAARELLKPQLIGKRGVRRFEHLYAPRDVIEDMDDHTRMLYSIYYSLGQEARRRAADKRKGL